MKGEEPQAGAAMAVVCAVWMRFAISPAAAGILSLNGVRFGPNGQAVIHSTAALAWSAVVS